MIPAPFIDDFNTIYTIPRFLEKERFFRKKLCLRTAKLFFLKKSFFIYFSLLDFFLKYGIIKKENNKV